MILQSGLPGLWAGVNAYNANQIPGQDTRLDRGHLHLSRYELWMRIREEQLRILPDVELCRALLAGREETRKVMGGLQITFRHPGAPTALAAVPGSAEQLLWTKAYLRAAALAPQDVRWVLDGGMPGLEVSVDVAWLGWQSLAAQGSASDAELAAALAADDTATGQMAHRKATMSRPDPAVKEAAWRRAHTVDGETNDAVDALMDGFGAPGQDALRARFAGRYFEHLTEVWRDHPIEIAMRLVQGGFPVDGVEAGHRWLREHPDAPDALRRLVREEVYEAEVAAHVRSANARAVPAPRVAAVD